MFALLLSLSLLRVHKWGHYSQPQQLQERTQFYLHPRPLCLVTFFFQKVSVGLTFISMSRVSRMKALSLTHEGAKELVLMRHVARTNFIGDICTKYTLSRTHTLTRGTRTLTRGTRTLMRGTRTLTRGTHTHTRGTHIFMRGTHTLARIPTRAVSRACTYTLQRTLHHTLQHSLQHTLQHTFLRMRTHTLARASTASC